VVCLEPDAFGLPLFGTSQTVLECPSNTETRGSSWWE